MVAKTQPTLEVHDDITIESVSDADWQKIAGDEEFMNQVLVVMLHTTTDENAPPHIVLSVNNTNQPLYRGVKTPVKRKYVEVLARCWETKYKQPGRDMSNPEAGNALIGTSAHAYPFTVLQDPDPRGRMWLEKILTEAN